MNAVHCSAFSPNSVDPAGFRPSDPKRFEAREVADPSMFELGRGDQFWRVFRGKAEIQFFGTSFSDYKGPRPFSDGILKCVDRQCHDKPGYYRFRTNITPTIASTPPSA